ncbi:CPA_1a_G0047960.mRNA.1.CDS.1 [Saccharomyces cerevisiae]|nr:CPA_1a_G0047960.mRNA.1.CDS.1 [Saccharomyces cerevisiae]CAI7452965.1 CPA_1a_G0047960.mRNA.1.CDS.1 [Saccharomyces cerevisiae]
MRMYCFMVPLCILMWGKVRMPIIGVPRCLKKPFSRACDASILVKKKNVRIEPSFRSLLSKPLFGVF